MTEHDTTRISQSDDAPAELRLFLTAYRPTGVTEENWAVIADDAVQLVLRAGALTRLRVEKDIQLLGAVVAHLVERGRPVTLDEALNDATLLSFDTSLQVGEKTKENKRGITRRLQAVHRGLPWRAEKRTPEERTENLVAHTEVATMHGSSFTRAQWATTRRVSRSSRPSPQPGRHGAVKVPPVLVRAHTTGQRLAGSRTGTGGT